MDEATPETEATATELLREELFASAVRRVKEWPDVGTFIVPRDNNFAAHLQLVQNLRAGSLRFDPAAYPCFDALVAKAAGKPAMFEPRHASYKRYADLRDNLAVVRNFIIGYYHQDMETYGDGGAYGPLELAEMATELGRAIRNEKRQLPRFIAPYLSTKLLNMEGDGASYAYWFLRKRQRQDGWLGDILTAIRAWLGLPLREWDLPPEEISPFTTEGLNGSAPPDVLCMPDEMLERYCQSMRHPPAAQEVAKYEQGRQDGLPVEDHLDTSRKRETIDHGITILRWFRDIEFSGKSAMEMIEAGTPEEKNEMVGLVSRFVEYYQQIAGRALKREPELGEREEVQEANAAAKVLKHTIKLLAALEKPVSMAQTQQISTDATRQPERWHEMANRTVNRLMETLKGGLESAVSAFDQQQQDQDQQQQEQAAEQAVDVALSHSDQARRKRRRKRQQASVGSGRKQQRVDQAFRADHASHGAHSKTAARERYVHEQVEFKQSLQVRSMALKDMELVKELGKALANSSSQPKEVKASEGGGGAGSLPKLSSLAMADVTMNDKLAPDAQDVASRIIDQRKREQNQGPKNTL